MEKSNSKRARARTLHTLYISPLKALAVDVARNLETPIAEMALPITVETRTGDTPAARRAREHQMILRRHVALPSGLHHCGGVALGNDGGAGHMVGRLHGVATPVNEALQRFAAEAARTRLAPGSVPLAELTARVDRYST